MKLADYQSRIATEAGLLRAVALSLDPDTPVPTCPGWTVRRLIQHLGRVFDMVIRVVQTADPQSPPMRVEP
ncbi:MAG TPA: maleylpyruvate isomerase N-terminal domain-containing protein, partial [Pseudonocardiaceae bacterium]|nr:maleylpyruvate isomerase N-terminal domain-containing protein [Pseudonocardiaceae bacterium]